MENTIINLEEDLRKTMLNNDFKNLEKLLSDNLKFVALNGIVISKSDDIAGYKNNIQKADDITILEQQIIPNDGFAIVISKAQVKGSYAQMDISGVYRYLRIWKKEGNSYKILSGSVVRVEE